MNRYIIRAKPRIQPGTPLSAREREVHELLRQGMSNKQIARRLAVSPNTVKAHLEAIFARLGVENRTQAALREAA